jgi:KDO2-lipid IV(A) lauroyltransferase
MTVFSALLYYGLIMPLSLLPFPVLHRISDLLFYLIYYLIGYRKKVVFTNLSNSFPEKTESQITDLAKSFYRHLCDLIVGSIKLFSISMDDVVARSKFVNPELLDAYFEEGRSIIIVAGHYNNWEFFAQSCNLQMKHQAVGIYTPLSNAFFEKKFSESRGRYDVILLPKNEVKQFFEANGDQKIAVIFGADQSPSPKTKRVYWTTFLNQDTAVMFGTEKYAREYGYPVIFAKMRRIGRSQFEISFELLEEDPANTAYGAITEKHTRMLEQQILEDPAYYLWTHRRWKRTRSEYGD